MQVSSTRHDVPTDLEKRFPRFSNSGTGRVTHLRNVLWATVTPRSAIISTGSRYDRRYVADTKDDCIAFILAENSNSEMRFDRHL